MDYTPGTETLEPRSLRLPKEAWELIEDRARASKRKPLDWLRLQIYERILNERRTARRAA